MYQKMPKWQPPPVIKNKIARYIMVSLAIGVALPIFLSSPYGLYFLVRGAARYYFRKGDFNREMKRLKKRGYIAMTKTPDGFLVRLLKKGRAKQKTFKMQDLKLPASKPWDGNWRLLIFDIPEGNKIKRDMLRRKLKDLGMYNFQRSVFAYPHDCRKELEFISEYYDLTKFTTYLETSQIDVDRELRAHFKLS